MRKSVYVWSGAAICASAAAWGISGLSGEKLRAATFVGPIQVGSLTPAAARTRLSQWWAEERRRERKLFAGERSTNRSLDALGVSFDITATLASAPRAGFLALPSQEPLPVRIEPVLRFDHGSLELLKKEFDAMSPPIKPARAVFIKEAVLRTVEQPKLEVDLEALPAAIQSQIGTSSVVRVPMAAAQKHVSDEALARITEVVGSYSTTFPTSKKSRCSNIRLAASKLDGYVLLPGERISFNEVVGRRTPKSGFRIAGVYRNGRHDFDVGGGICQVSSTMYNAALLSNLKIIKRYNHSMPVAYVPLGRDATVDYGVLDLVLENNTEAPIAISSEYRPGRLKFRILGERQPGLSVKIESQDGRNWDVGTRTLVDPSLPSGAVKVLEKGSKGHSVNTYRLVYRHGKLVVRESLGKSYYRGGQKIIAVGKPAEAPKLPAQATVVANGSA